MKKTFQRRLRKTHAVGRTHQKRSISREPSMGQLSEKYLQHLAVKGFSENTLRVRRIYMEMFLNWCRRCRATAANQITRTSLENYQRYLFQYKKKDGQPLAVAGQHSRLRDAECDRRLLCKGKNQLEGTC
jgi:integrase/recombinase XerD